jgi:hypothetical protein
MAFVEKQLIARELSFARVATVRIPADAEQISEDPFQEMFYKRLSRIDERNKIN